MRWHEAAAMTPGPRQFAQPKDRDMQTDTNRQNEIFRIVAGVMMVAVILFGVLELMDVIHV